MPWFRSVEWRKSVDAEKIRAVAADMMQKDFPFSQRLRTCYPHTITHGQDKSGQPISIERTGHCNPAEIVKQISVEEMLQYNYHHVEHKAVVVAKLSEERGKIVRAQLDC